MKYGYLFFMLFVVLVVRGQLCTSQRYSKPVFSTVNKTSQVFYGSARPYASATDLDLYLDIYEPAGDTLRYRPFIIYAYGGAFLIGDKNQPPIPTFCEYFAKCGYVVVSIDYRKGFNLVDPGSPPRAVYRAAQDERAAMRFLCQRAAQYRLDTAAIFLTGSSAGCFSALHQTFMEESQRPQESYGITLEPSDLGCFDCAGNADNGRHCPRVRGIINNWGAILDTNLIGGYNAHDSVAVISFHGDADPAVPYVSGNPFSYPVFPTVYGSKSIHRRMDNQRMKNKLVTLVGQGHEPWLLDASLLDTVYKYTCPFLLDVLKPLPLQFTGDSVLCEQAVATYQVNDRMGSTYCWQVDSGGTILNISGNAITIQWNTTGWHQISVRELSKNEVNGDSFSYRVRVVARPHAGFAYMVNHTQVVFMDSTQLANQFFWQFGDGQTSGVMQPVHQYAGAGSFSVVQVAGNGYCADTFIRVVETDTCPRPDFSWQQRGDSMYFVPDPLVGSNWSWSFGDGQQLNVAEPVVSYGQSGNFLVSLQLVAGKNCPLSISKIVSFSRPAGLNNVEEELYRVAPVFGTKEVIFDFPQAALVRIFNVVGKEVYRMEVAAGYQRKLLAELSEGCYLVNIENQLLINTKKVFLVSLGR
ncbi:MAG: alpha/beta hydrolase fold domain-containing protein [Chitinophagales bacterium]